MFSYVYTTYFDHIYAPIPLSDPPPSLENLFPTICPPPIQSFVTVIWHCHPHICWTPLVTIKGYMCPVGCRLDTPRLDFILMPTAMLLYAQLLPVEQLPTVLYWHWSQGYSLSHYRLCSCTQHLGRSLGAGSTSLSFLCLWCWVWGPAHKRSSEKISWMNKCILAPWPVIYVNFRSSKSQNRRVQDELSVLKDLIAQLNGLLYLLWIKSPELKGLLRDWKTLAGFATICSMAT